MSSVDVIVPCYRYGKFLEECVMSILNQEDTNVKVLILDDASPDETPEVARRLASQDSRVTYVRHAQNKGHIKTYNDGIEWISSDYYLLLSADDYLIPGALGRAVAALDENPRVGFVFGNAVVAFDDGSRGAQRPFVDDEIVPNDRIMDTREFIILNRARNIVPTPTAVVRTKLQKKCGGYKEEFPHAGDMEMWLRLSAHGDVGFIDADQAVYRRHTSNMSLSYAGTSMLPDVQQRLAVLQAFFAENSTYLGEWEDIRRDCMQWLAEDALSYAHIAFNHGNRQLSAQLTDASLSIFPSMKRTLKWWKLIAKRVVGPSVWTALRSYRPQA